MSEADKIENQFLGAGHHAKRGTLNLQHNNNNEHFTTMTEGEIDEHIVGVMLAQQHGLKKGLKLFGEKAEKAFSKELHQIHDLETYEPLRASDLSLKEKNRGVERSCNNKREKKRRHQG